MSRRRRSRAVLLFIALSLAGIGTAVAIYWKELRLEWHRGAAIDEIRGPNFKPLELGAATRLILESSPENRFTLSRMLTEDDFDVWRRVVFLIDSHLDDNERRDLIDYLRKRHTFALVRYLLIDPYSVATEWGGNATPWGFYMEATTAEPYWTAGHTSRLRPSTGAVRFLESVLDRKQGPGPPRKYWWRFRARAISALASMLPAGIEFVGPGAPAAGSIEARIVRALVRATRTGENIGLRFHALASLAALPPPRTPCLATRSTTAS